MLHSSLAPFSRYMSPIQFFPRDAFTPTSTACPSTTASGIHLRRPTISSTADPPVPCSRTTPFEAAAAADRLPCPLLLPPPLMLPRFPFTKRPSHCLHDFPIRLVRRVRQGGGLGEPLSDSRPPRLKDSWWPLLKKVSWQRKVSW